MSRPSVRVALIAGGIGLLLATSIDGKAAAPSGHFVLGAGTVADTATLLTWEQPLDGIDRTYADAVTHCQMLALAGGGWRIPSWKELLTLIDDSTSNPAVDPAFVGAAPSYHWSSTLFTTSRRTVEFNAGFTSVAPETDMHPVRCVR